VVTSSRSLSGCSSRAIPQFDGKHGALVRGDLDVLPELVDEIEFAGGSSDVVEAEADIGAEYP